MAILSFAPAYAAARVTLPLSRLTFTLPGEAPFHFGWERIRPRWLDHDKVWPAAHSPGWFADSGRAGAPA